jgi:hypothetical protein
MLQTYENSGVGSSVDAYMGDNIVPSRFSGEQLIHNSQFTVTVSNGIADIVLQNFGVTGVFMCTLCGETIDCHDTYDNHDTYDYHKS